jgi:hypothetical protein
LAALDIRLESEEQQDAAMVKGVKGHDKSDLGIELWEEVVSTE